MQKEQQKIKELEKKTEQQAKVLKVKTEEMVAVHKRLRSASQISRWILINLLYQRHKMTNPKLECYGSIY